jgi:hypothetical protein
MQVVLAASLCMTTVKIVGHRGFRSRLGVAIQSSSHGSKEQDLESRQPLPRSAAKSHFPCTLEFQEYYFVLQPPGRIAREVRAGPRR